MAKRSGPKGDEFEREIAKTLNEAFNTEEFARTPGSGALTGLSNFAKRMGLSEDVRRTLGSDLIVPDWFRFSVECKWYKDSPNYATIIKGNDSDLDVWLGETVFDAINFGLNPLLFFKTNRKGVHVALPKTFMAGEVNLPVYLTHYLVYNEFIIIGLDQFLEHRINIVDIGDHELENTMMWLENSQYIKQLLLNLQEQKKKSKPKKRK